MDIENCTFLPQQITAIQCFSERDIVPHRVGCLWFHVIITVVVGVTDVHVSRMMKKWNVFERLHGLSCYLEVCVHILC